MNLHQRPFRRGVHDSTTKRVMNFELLARLLDSAAVDVTEEIEIDEAPQSEVRASQGRMLAAVASR